MNVLSDQELKDLVNCTPDQGLVITKPYRILKTWLNPCILHIDVYRSGVALTGESVENWLVHAIDGRIIEAVQIVDGVTEDGVIDRWTVRGMVK